MLATCLLINIQISGASHGNECRPQERSTGPAAKSADLKILEKAERKLGESGMPVCIFSTIIDNKIVLGLRVASNVSTAIKAVNESLTGFEGYKCRRTAPGLFRRQVEQLGDADKFECKSSLAGHPSARMMR